MALRIPVEELIHRLILSDLRQYVVERETYRDPPNFPRDEIIAALDMDYAPNTGACPSWWPIGELLVTGWPDVPEAFGPSEEMYCQFVIPALLMQLADMFGTLESEAVRESAGFAAALAEKILAMESFMQVRESYPDELVRRDSRVLVMAANFHRLKMLSPTAPASTGPSALRITTVVIALLSGRTFEEARAEFVLPVTSQMGKGLLE